MKPWLVVFLGILWGCDTKQGSPTGSSQTDSGVAPQDSGETGTPETGDSGPIDTDDPPVADPSWACTTSPSINPSTLSDPMLHSEGLRYRVVEVETSAFEHFFVVVLYPPAAYRNAYDVGAPVVVTSMQSIGIGIAWATEPRSYFPLEMGVVEVQPVHPQWTANGHTTSGQHDGAGPMTSIALAEAVRFATGQTKTVTGRTLRDLVNREICPGKVAVLGQSSGGITLAGAMVRQRDALDNRLIGLAFYETPSRPSFVVADSGFMSFDSAPAEDADGNGVSWDDGRNPAFGDCALEELACELDLSTLAWSMTYAPGDIAPVDFSPGALGVLYLDRNGNRRLDLDPNGTPDLNRNGWIDEDEDYFFLPYQAQKAPEPELQMYSPSVIRGAVTSGVLSTSAWPEQVAPPEANATFWSERDVTSLMTAVTEPLPTVVGFRERDHAVPQGDHPHVQVLHAALGQAGMTPRYNMPLEVAQCLIDSTTYEDWAGGTAFDMVDESADLLPLAIPDTVPPRVARAAATLSLFWETWGPFDACPYGISSR